MKTSSQIVKSWGNRHIDDRLNSRNCSKTFDYHSMPCEFCFMRQAIEWRTQRIQQVSEVHHNTQSMRWERTHHRDGSDLIWVCRKCHNFLHADNKHDTRWLVSIIIWQVKKRAKQWKEEWEDVASYLRQKFLESRHIAHLIHDLIKIKKV